MANSLNVRLVNMVTDIAQGDNASTVILELLDENKLIMPNLDGYTTNIYLIDKNNDIKYQHETFVFDSRVEFNIEAIIPSGVYKVEIRVAVDQYTYIFPSNFNFQLRINESSIIK